MSTLLPPDFHPVLQRWWASRFAEPTAAQIEGWRAIRSGNHTLIAAPTGSGKTLAAFLFARGNPELERRLVEHPRWGPPIRDAARPPYPATGPGLVFGVRSFEVTAEAGELAGKRQQLLDERQRLVPLGEVRRPGPAWAWPCC